MSEPMRDEVELPELETKHGGHCQCIGCDKEYWYQVAKEREAQLKAALSANRDKDAQLADSENNETRWASDFRRMEGRLAKFLDRAEKAEAEFASLRASGGEKWIEIKEGCEMPEYGVPVWVVWKGVVQNMTYVRDIGEWVPVSDDYDTAPDGTFSHWMHLPAPPTLTREKE